MKLNTKAITINYLQAAQRTHGLSLENNIKSSTNKGYLNNPIGL